jgi:hypothetical protein
VAREGASGVGRRSGGLGAQAARGERAGRGPAATDGKIRAVRISNVLFDAISSIISNIAKVVSTFIS